MHVGWKLALTLLALLCTRIPAQAGCGCDKPPPPVAAIRPAFASPTNEVTLFSSSLVPGKRYRVIFGEGWPRARRRVWARAEMRRDFADGIVKPQLVARVPGLPAGPTRVVVKRGATVILDIPPAEFTLLQRPIALAQANGMLTASCYRAAVGTDGVMYLPLDISAITQRMVFSGMSKQLKLAFAASDIAIYNAQGVLMQLLGPAEANIYAIVDHGGPDSFELTYDRHEFETYRERHLHEGGLGLDPTDPAWHSDGSRHIDHDHLVIAIRAKLQSQGALAPLVPGTTPTFAFRIATALADVPGAPPADTLIEWSDECQGQSSNGDDDADAGNGGDDGGDTPAPPTP
jgi:hypothetical protein